MRRVEIEKTFEIELLTNMNEVIEFHNRHYGGQMIVLSLSDIKELVEGKFFAWSTGQGEYSEVLYLDEEAKEVIKKIV